jgi:hypothetical protein
VDPRGHSTIALLAAIIIYLVRMRISNITNLLGLESNAELERARAINSGHPPGENPYVEPLDTCETLTSTPAGVPAAGMWVPGCRLASGVHRPTGRGTSAGKDTPTA